MTNLNSRYIRSSAGMVLARILGLNPQPGYQYICCPCGCGHTTNIPGYVINTNLTTSQLNRLGLITSAIYVNGIY
jgi:hypothetical protein